MNTLGFILLFSTWLYVGKISIIKTFLKSICFSIARIVNSISTSFSPTPFMFPVEETLAQEDNATLLLTHLVSHPLNLATASSSSGTAKTPKGRAI